MQIIDTRHVTPDDYSIEKIHVGYDWGHHSKYVQAYISVALKPDGYHRTRFADGGQSYETKKHGAERLIIRAPELQQMMEALTDELQLCQKVILEHDLVAALIEARHKKTAEQSHEEPIASAATSAD
jgi:hypothetical protein